MGRFGTRRDEVVVLGLVKLPSGKGFGAVKELQLAGDQVDPDAWLVIFATEVATQGSAVILEGGYICDDGPRLRNTMLVDHRHSPPRL